MSGFMIATGGLRLARTPSIRDLRRRRLRIILAVIAALAVAGGVAGYLTTPDGPAAARSGPFSYFPR